MCLVLGATCLSACIQTTISNVHHGGKARTYGMGSSPKDIVLAFGRDAQAVHKCPPGIHSQCSIVGAGQGEELHSVLRPEGCHQVLIVCTFVQLIIRRDVILDP